MRPVTLNLNSPIDSDLLPCIVQWRDKYPRIACREEQFPPNWKAQRPFRHWCYLAAVLPSWPSMKDEPLYISSLSLWMEPKLHHHSNGCLAYTPRDIVIPQIAWKKAMVCVAADFEALKVCVCAYIDVILCSSWCRLHLSVWIIDQGDHGIYDKGWKSPSHTPEPSPLFWSKGKQLWNSLFQNKLFRWPNKLPNKILLFCDSSGAFPSCFALKV